MVATINRRPIGPVGPKINLFTNRTPSKRNVNISLLVNNKNITVKNRNLSSRRIYPTVVKTSIPKPEFVTVVQGNRRNNNRRTLKLIPAPAGPMKVHKTANFVFPEAGIATAKKINRPAAATATNFKYTIPNNAAKKIITLDVEKATPIKATQFTVNNNTNKRRGRFGSNKVGVASRHLLGGRKRRTMKRRHSHRRRRA